MPSGRRPPGTARRSRAPPTPGARRSPRSPVGALATCRRCSRMSRRMRRSSCAAKRARSFARGRSAPAAVAEEHHPAPERGVLAPGLVEVGAVLLEHERRTPARAPTRIVATFRPLAATGRDAQVEVGRRGRRPARGGCGPCRPAGGAPGSSRSASRPARRRTRSPRRRSWRGRRRPWRARSRSPESTASAQARARPGSRAAWRRAPRPPRSGVVPRAPMTTLRDGERIRAATVLETVPSGSRWRASNLAARR